MNDWESRIILFIELSVGLMFLVAGGLLIWLIRELTTK